MKKIFTLFLTVLLVAVLMLGCVQNDNTVPNDTENLSTQNGNLPGDLPEETQNGSLPENIIDGDTTVDGNAIEIVQGTYVGLIDNNSFEATVDNQPIAFRIIDAPQKIQDAGINDGDMVEISFYKDETGSNIVQKIEKVMK